MSNADWRAQLREAGIDRRPPPSSKGALQDKVAAVPVTVLRPSRPNKPNNVITIEQLAKYSEPPSPTIVPPMTRAIAPEKSAVSSSSPSAPPVASAPSPSPTSPPTSLRQPALFAPNVVEMPADSYHPPPSELQPSTEGSEMPKKVSKRNKYGAELRERVVRQIIDGPPGTAARLSREHGLSDGLVSQWVTRYRRKHPEGRTLVSHGHSPKSETLVKASELPPPPAVHLTGLEDYIRAIVEREVEAALKAWKRRMFEGD